MAVGPAVTSRPLVSSLPVTVWQKIAVLPDSKDLAGISFNFKLPVRCVVQHATRIIWGI